MVPAITTLLALVLGAGLSSFEARRLERQKFQFEVLKFTLAAGVDPVRRVRSLCEFASLGFIEDDGRYRRAEIGGVRPCAPPRRYNTFYPTETVRELTKDVGIAEDHSGEPSFEQGYLKFGGRLADVRVLEDRPVRTSAIRTVLVGYVRSGRERWPDEALKSNGDAAVSQLMVKRDGSTIQVGNLFSDLGGTVRIGLVNAGELSFGTESRGYGFRLFDSAGRVVPRDSGVDFRHVGADTFARQRFPSEQLRTAERLVAAICANWPNVRVIGTPYVVRTLSIQGDDRVLHGCRSQI